MNLAQGDLDDESISWTDKGFPVAADGLSVSRFVAGQPSMFEVGFEWPIMTLRDSAISHNIETLARWCSASGMSLAPHGKTTMAPAIFGRQLAAGAWAMCAATPWQVRAYRHFGVPRVLLANVLTDKCFGSWLVDALSDPAFDFLCYVDSVAGVTALGEATAKSPRRVQVLLEVGVSGGRTGVRTRADAFATAEAVRQAGSLSLVGVAGYEGPFGHDRDAKTLAAVRDYTTDLGELLQQLDNRELLDRDAGEFVLTCGGSGHIDVVTAGLSRSFETTASVRPVLRSGSYVTHDDGLYAHTSALAAQLRPAIEVWCEVWSRPEPGLALLGAGRRDLPFDAGPPVALWRRSATTGEIAPLQATVTKLNDQHGYLELDADEPLAVGDLVGLGISHPCTAHDKWRLVPLLDDARQLIGCIRSYF
jgi:D-serine deaminase-like pyridoxal phosphate-dependent protein